MCRHCHDTKRENVLEENAWGTLSHVNRPCRCTRPSLWSRLLGAICKVLR